MKLSGLKDWGNSSAGRFDVRSAQAKTGFNNSALHKRNGATLIIAIALFWTAIFASVAIFALKDGSSSELNTTAKSNIEVVKTNSPEMVDVLVANKDIEQDRSLEPSMFIKVWRPKSALPSNSISSFDQLRNSFAKNFIPAHQALTREVMTKERPVNPVIRSIPDGYRAVTININATTGTEGWARAEATVDIQWISDVGGKRTIQLLVANAKVLSAERQIDPHAEPGSPIPTTATLLVRERDAQKVSLAQSSGTLILHLRGANDGKLSEAGGPMSLSDIRGSDGENLEAGVEGYVRVKGKDGEDEEFAVMGGKVVRRKM